MAGEAADGGQRGQRVVVKATPIVAVQGVAVQAQDDDDAVRARNVLEDEVWLYRELRKVRRRTA